MAAPSYSRGDIVTTRSRRFDVHNPGPPITKTEGGRPGPHPFIVMATSPKEKSVTGIMLRTYGGATSLAEVSDIDVTLYKWFLPIIPAPKESIHDPIPHPPDLDKGAKWVVLYTAEIPVDEIVRSIFLCSYLFE